MCIADVYTIVSCKVKLYLHPVPSAFDILLVIHIDNFLMQALLNMRTDWSISQQKRKWQMNSSGSQDLVA